MSCVDVGRLGVQVRHGRHGQRLVSSSSSVKLTLEAFDREVWEGDSQADGHPHRLVSRTQAMELAEHAPGRPG